MQKVAFRRTLLEDVVEACAANGLLIKQKNTRDDIVEYQHAPISLFPSPYPFHIYQQVHDQQHPIGCLVSSLTSQPNQIYSILKHFLKYDPFLERLVGISKSFNEFALSDNDEMRKKIQSMQVCILRCDFMIDQPTNCPKLVEFNTIASSFGALCQKVNKIQDYINVKYSDDIKYGYQQLDSESMESEKEKQILEFAKNGQQSFLDKIVKNFKKIIDLYKENMKQKFDHECKDAWVLFVVEGNERNKVDQKLIETELQFTYGIKSMRLNLNEVKNQIAIDEKTHIITIRGKEIGFVYYRSGYQVEQYTCEDDYEARRLLEISQALKCPSIDVHLGTFKKFQQAFCNRSQLQEVMEPRYPTEFSQIVDTFTGMWSLEDFETNEDVKATVDKAIENPRNYVVKPQKEGGGNNFFDDDAKKLLETFKNPKSTTEEKEKLKQFMIMERINPPMMKGWMLRDGQILEMDSLSELGLFSCVIMDSSKKEDEVQILLNENIGTLMRTKGSHSNEGGVNAGYAVIDYPILYKEPTGKISQQIKPNVSNIPQ